MRFTNSLNALGLFLGGISITTQQTITFLLTVIVLILAAAANIYVIKKNKREANVAERKMKYFDKKDQESDW